MKTLIIIKMEEIDISYNIYGFSIVFFNSKVSVKYISGIKKHRCETNF